MSPAARIAKAIWLLSLCVQSFVSAGTSNFVLCVGEDGHMAVERSSSLNRTGEAACGLPSRIAASPADSHCGSCSDSPLALSASDPAQAGRVFTAGNELPQPLVIARLPEAIFAAIPPSHPSPLISGRASATASQSPVLRI